MTCYYHSISAPLLHSIALAFVVIICWSATVVVVSATSEDVHFFREIKQGIIAVSPAATISVTIPTTSFVVSCSHGVSFSSLFSSRRSRRLHHHIHDSRTNAIINNRSMSQNHFPRHNRLSSMSSSDAEQSNNDDEPNQAENNMVIIDELSWRVAKVRLEEANTKRFLNRKPLKMSYLQSRQFIQRNWGPIRTRKEFEDLVSNGDLKTPYISKRPEEYYGRRGEWISWEHYLLGECSSGDDGSSNGNSDSGTGGSSDAITGHDRKNSTGTDVVLKWQ